MTPKTYESLAQAAERTSLSTKTLRRRIAPAKLRAYRERPKILSLSALDLDLPDVTAAAAEEAPAPALPVVSGDLRMANFVYSMRGPYRALMPQQPQLAK